MAISQTVSCRIILSVLQPENLLDMLNLRVLDNLLVPSFSNVEKFSSEREDAVIISSDHTQPRNSEGFGRIPFSQDKSASLGVAAPGVIGVLEFDYTRNSTQIREIQRTSTTSLPRSLRAIRLLHDLVLLEFGPVKHIVDDAGFADCKAQPGHTSHSPFLTKSSDSSHLLPNAELLSVKHSFVWESKAGFSTRAFTKIHI